MARWRSTAGPERDEDQLWRAIARLVAEQRQARRLSQREVAELCGTTQSAIARIERGARPPRLDTLRRIANALDCELMVHLRARTTTGEGNDEEPR